MSRINKKESDIIVDINEINKRILTLRGLQVMLDRDLAALYGVETRILNQAVKRNIKRFPEEFMFQMTKDEMNNWKSQIVISNRELMGLRTPPYAFTEAGVSMLASVLKSKTAVAISINIIKAFIRMRKFIANNAAMFQRLEKVELKQLDADQKIEKLFDAMQSGDLKPKQGIFYDGQIFDAYVFVTDLLKKATKSIILIDNYIDETVLTMLSKRRKNCKAVIYTQKISRQLTLDLQKYNSQYPAIELKENKKSHDRFLIIDRQKVYHIGASLKDLGKKWFAFSLIKIDSEELLAKLEGPKSSKSGGQ